MTTWLIHRQWESLFAIAELAQVPALLWMTAGALILLARTGHRRWGTVLRSLSTLGLIALAALVIACGLNAGLTTDAVLAQQLRSTAIQMGLSVLIGAGATAAALLLIGTMRSAVHRPTARRERC